MKLQPKKTYTNRKIKINVWHLPSNTNKQPGFTGLTIDNLLLAALVEELVFVLLFVILLRFMACCEANKSILDIINVAFECILEPILISCKCRLTIVLHSTQLWELLLPYPLQATRDKTSPLRRA